MIAAQQNRLWDYKILQKIGQGQYGMVFKVQHKHTNQVYALKKINISNMSQKQKIDAFKEIKTLKKLDHPNIIKYHQSFLSVDNLYIVMEYAEKGDLAAAIRRRRQTLLKYKEYELWALFKILCSAVKHLHENSVIHRDIKLENIFVTKDNVVKLGDLGLSKILQSKADLQSQRVGTPIYFAPQLIQHMPYSFSIDIWALGCVFYTLTNLTHPFQGATLQTLSYHVLLKGPWPLKNCTYSAQLVRFIFSLLDKNPATRPEIDKVLKSTNIAQLGEQESRVSVYNSKVLSAIVKDTKEGLKRSGDGKETTLLSYRRVVMRRNRLEDQSGQESGLFEDEKKEQHVNLSDMLKNILNKKITDLDIMTERKRSHDQNPQTRDDSIQFQTLRKSAFTPNPNLIKTNGFDRQKFKIHLVQTRYPQSKSPIPRSKATTLTPRQKYHKIHL